MPFLDRDIHDPRASQLANHPKRKHHDSQAARASLACSYLTQKPATPAQMGLPFTQFLFLVVAHCCSCHYLAGEFKQQQFSHLQWCSSALTCRAAACLTRYRHCPSHFPFWPFPQFSAAYKNISKRVPTHSAGAIQAAQRGGGAGGRAGHVHGAVPWRRARLAAAVARRAARGGCRQRRCMAEFCQPGSWSRGCCGQQGGAGGERGGGAGPLPARGWWQGVHRRAEEELTGGECWDCMRRTSWECEDVRKVAAP